MESEENFDKKLRKILYVYDKENMSALRIKNTLKSDPSLRIVAGIYL